MRYIDHCILEYIMSMRDLNHRQWHLIELLVDYDISILYHHGKSNVVADALSRKVGSIGSLPTVERPLCIDI